MWIRELSDLFSHSIIVLIFYVFSSLRFFNLFFEHWPSRSLQVRPRSLPTPVAKEDWDQVGCTNRSSFFTSCSFREFSVAIPNGNFQSGRRFDERFPRRAPMRFNWPLWIKRRVPPVLVCFFKCFSNGSELETSSGQSGSWLYESCFGSCVNCDILWSWMYKGDGT